MPCFWGPCAIFSVEIPWCYGPPHMPGSSKWRFAALRFVHSQDIREIRDPNAFKTRLKCICHNIALSETIQTCTWNCTDMAYSGGIFFANMGGVGGQNYFQAGCRLRWPNSRESIRRFARIAWFSFSPSSTTSHDQTVAEYLDSLQMLIAEDIIDAEAAAKPNPRLHYNSDQVVINLPANRVKVPELNPLFANRASGG